MSFGIFNNPLMPNYIPVHDLYQKTIKIGWPEIASVFLLCQKRMTQFRLKTFCMGKKNTFNAETHRPWFDHSLMIVFWLA